MRLTTDLITSSLSYLNPLKERELDLRGHKIPAIENLGVAKDHDAIDFTDNDIQILGNFPLSPRLRTLLLARNRISGILSTLPKTVPNLRVLIMNSNSIQELADLDPLAGCVGLTHLVLMDNPVTRKENYRHYLIWRCPSIRFLDYQRVKDIERKHATELFGTIDDPSPLAAKIMGIKSRTFDLGPSTSSREKEFTTRLTDEERKILEARIKNAKSLDEVARLEKELREGVLVIGGGGDAMEE
ncbi:L domain-like protein [Terfezia boudieri ATCC MYA-4762]|uniref:U2 small nuclear ribonucleoprotein A' n=1 Tax=Terfezia boudieri ATCC MYA-4762 TaxID=1051890 RepID=A0A3N4LD20_9PEZI|nr:L domain-like protein [Terfezia boudieri ATCC MYA-4762]